jgi:hypothetical protein
MKHIHLYVSDKAMYFDSAARLRDFMSKHSRPDFDELWLSEEVGGFPALAINTSGRDAVIHFFPEAGHPGFQSIGVITGGGKEDITFRFGDIENKIPASAVVSWLIAVDVAVEFFATHSMSTKLKWIEL